MGKDALHKVVAKDKVTGADKRELIKTLLAVERKVPVVLSADSQQSEALLIDQGAIWRGLQQKRKVFDDVAFPAEDEVAFREASKDSQRLLTAKAGRVQRLDRDSTSDELDKKGRLLVSVPADPDFRDKHGFTPLYLAARRAHGGRDEIVALVQGYANPNAQIATKEVIDGRLRRVAGGSPLIAAVESGNKNNVEILLTLGANTKQRIWANGSDGQTRQFTPLMYSSDKHHLVIREQHLKGKKLAVGPEVWQEITEMLAQPAETVVNFVKEAPGLACIKNLNGEYVLHIICNLEGAVSAADVEQIIAAFPAAVMLMTAQRDLPLHLALREGSMEPDVIAQLMRLPDGWEKGFKRAHKADLVVAEAQAFNNPMLEEEDESDAEEGEEEMLPTVLQDGQLVRVPDIYGCLPLHLALRSSAGDVVLKVLEEFPEAAQEADGDGDTCLRLALVRCKAVPADSNEAEAREETMETDIKGDLDGDGVLEADEREALEDHEANSSDTDESLFEDDFGDDPMYDQFGIGARREPSSAEVIEAVLNANPGSSSQVDVDGRTPLQLATELNIPPEQYRTILDANPGAVTQPLVRAPLTISVTVPGELTDENRNVIAKLPNNHTAHVTIPPNLNAGQVFRTKSNLDAKILYLKIPLTAKPGSIWTDAISSGQGIKVEVPPLETMRLHPNKKTYWHPFEMEDLEDLDFFVPTSAKAGNKTKVYTQEGSHLSIIVPERAKDSETNKVPVVIRPHRPTHPDNVENLLHAAVTGATLLTNNGNEDIIAILAEEYPALAEARNRYNMLPLHLVMIDNATVKSTRALLDAYPGAASIETDSGDLPLHILLQNAGLGVNVDVEVAVMVLKANPDALAQKDSLGMYPLHSALNKFGEMEAFILEAMEYEIEGESPACIPTEEGEYPLHLALENESTVATVRAIAEAFPEAITKERQDGTTNVRNVFILGDRRRRDLDMPRVKQLCEIAQVFFKAEPSLLAIEEGVETPLHHILNSQSADRLVKTIVEAHAEQGNLQEALMADFNDGQDLPLLVMLEQNRGLHLIKACLELCEDPHEIMHARNAANQIASSVMMDHCTRKDVAEYLLEQHRQYFSDKHQATPEQELFLAARTGNDEAVKRFVEENSVDFNAQDINGRTAKEVAMSVGHRHAASLMPKAISTALSKKAMIAQAVAINGPNAKRTAVIKWHVQPYIVVAWCFLHYFDIYNDLSLTFKFGNVHFPPFNVQCGCSYVLFNPSCSGTDTLPMFEKYSLPADAYDGPCSTYMETGFFVLSATFILMGLTAACLIDYFMMRSTETNCFIGLHWMLNISLVRMFYEMSQALRNIWRGRMPQAGLAAVKAAEGLFESVPQLLLQAFILFRIILEPLRPPAPDGSFYGTQCTREGTSECTHDPAEVRQQGTELARAGGPDWANGVPAGNPWIPGEPFNAEENAPCGADTFVTWTQLLEEAEFGGGWGTGGMRAPDACVFPDETYHRAGYSLHMQDYLDSTREIVDGALQPGWNCTLASPYHPSHCNDCPMTTYSEVEGHSYGECLSSSTIWSQLAISVSSGLLSTSSSVAMLPENVRGQWRIFFGLYIVCQVIFRVFALMMAATVFSISGNAWIFWVMFMSMYATQSLISKPRRIDIAKEMLKQRNARVLQKELMQQRKMAVSRVSADYDVMEMQYITAGSAVSSPVVQEFNKQTGKMVAAKVNPGDVVHSVESEWLPSGLHRVKLKKGWLNIQDKNGKMLLKIRDDGLSSGTEDDMVVGWREKLWIGLLTIIVPVQFDTIKNIHKSNPRQETFISFGLRMLFNLIMTAPYLYYYPLVGTNEDMIGEVPYTYSQPWATADTPGIEEAVWHERISVSRAKNLMMVTYGFGFASFWLYIFTHLVRRVH